MPNWIITGIIAGLAASAMQGTILSPSPLNAIIFYLSPIPLFMAGFSRGSLSALLGTVLMAAVLAILTGSMTFALMSVVSAGLAPVVAAQLSMITRSAAVGSSSTPNETANEGETRSDDREWYPEGRLILWLAAIATLVTGITILAMGFDFATYKTFITGFVDQFVSAVEKQMPADQPPFPKALFASVIVTALPIAASAIWLLATVTSMRIAIVILSRTGKALRPWALFGHMAYPKNSVIALLASLIAAYFLTGMAQLLALGAVGAFVTAFTLLGLAIVHNLLADSVARPFLLAFLYAGLLLFNWLLAVPLTLLGLIDLNFNFRKSKSIQS